MTTTDIPDGTTGAYWGDPMLWSEEAWVPLVECLPPEEFRP